jgi:hypothetical protein
MSNTETFHLGDLLSITSGILVSPDRIGGVYRIVDFVTGQQHLTHQLPRASQVVKPWLIQQHPWLDEITVPSSLSSEAEVFGWLATATGRWGEHHEVTRMPFGMYVGRDPIAELREMAPHAQIIQVEMPPEDN